MPSFVIEEPSVKTLMSWHGLGLLKILAAAGVIEPSFAQDCQDSSGRVSD